MDNKEFDFHLMIDSYGKRELELAVESAKHYKIGVPTYHSKYGAEEWGYNFFHNNNNVSGDNRLIISGYQNEPKTRKEALEEIRGWLFRQYTSLNEVEHWHSMNSYYNFQHYAGMWGANEIGTEIGENVGSYQQRLAFTRGAGKQFGATWFMDFSSWYSNKIRDYSDDMIWVGSSGPENGHSLNIMERAFMMCYLAGADFMEVEGGIGCTIYDRTDQDGFYVSTPFGDVCAKVRNFTKEYPKLQNPVIPFAVVLDTYHGIQGGWTDFEGFTDSSFGCFPYEAADYMTSDVMTFFFSDGWKIGESIYKAVSEESNKIANVKFADKVDIFLQNVSADVLKHYPCVLLSGNIEFSDDEVKKFISYAENGGRLLLNTAYLKYFPETEKLYDKTSLCRIPFKNGEIIVYGEDFKIDNVKPILEECYKKYIPFDMSHEVQSIVSKTEDGIYLTLINNKGVQKSFDKKAEFDANEDIDLTVLYTGREKCKFNKAIYGDSVITEKDGAVNINLGPGNIAVLQYLYY